MPTDTANYCRFCATVNTEEATHCKVCQHALRIAEQDVQPATDKKSRIRAFISRIGMRIGTVTFFNLQR